MSTPSCCPSLSFSLSARAAPRRTALLRATPLHAARSPSARYLSLSRAPLSSSLSRQLPRARKTSQRGEEEFPHTRMCAAARARKRCTHARTHAGPHFESRCFARRLLAVYSRAVRSVGNVERESGIAVAPLFLPSRCLHSLLPPRPPRRRRRCSPSERVPPRSHGAASSSQRAVPHRVARPTLVFLYNLLGSRAFFSLLHFRISSPLRRPPLVATPPSLPFASLSYLLFALSSSCSSIVHPLQKSFFSFCLCHRHRHSMPLCLYLCSASVSACAYTSSSWCQP